MSEYLVYLKKRTADYLASETLSIETSTAIAMIEAQERQAEALTRIADWLDKPEGPDPQLERIAASLELITRESAAVDCAAFNKEKQYGRRKGM